jgi:putative membrane protein
MRTFLFAALAALTFSLAASPALAAGHDDGPAFGPISAKTFLARAAAGNRFEIVTGRLAQQKASSAAIKRHGAEFVTDHTDLLNKGAAVASQLGVSVPSDLPRAQQRIVNALQRLSGRAFDRAWLRAQLDAHAEALALLLRGAIRGEAPAIRTLAQGGLPVVTKHYGELLDLAGNGRSHH